MTTLIIGLIAALGIGGGIAVASNSGGGGHNSPAISAPAVPGEDNSDNPGSGDNPGGDNPGGDNPGGDNPGGDNPGGDNPGGDNPGGDNPGGDNPGGDNPGGDNPGGDNPGGDNPGGDNPGGDNPGGDNPGGDNPGGDNPGGDNPGGDNPGEDNSLNPNYSLISFLTDTAQYKQVRMASDNAPDEYSLINDGSTHTYRALEVGNDGKSFKVTTGAPRLKDGQFQQGGIASYRLLEDKIEFSMDASSKLNENDKFIRYQKQRPKNGYLYGQYITVQHDYNLYLGGSKAELSVGDFGFSYEIINYLYGTYSQYNRRTIYDADHLYTGGRTDTNPIRFAGNALMWAEDLNQGVAIDPVVHGGSFTMDLHLPTASGSGSINMGLDAKYDANFDVKLTNINQLTFSGKDIVEDKGYLLNGKDGLESVGSLHKDIGNNQEVTYSYGAKEVK